MITCKTKAEAEALCRGKDTATLRRWADQLDLLAGSEHARLGLKKMMKDAKMKDAGRSLEEIRRAAVLCGQFVHEVLDDRLAKTEKAIDDFENLAKGMRS